MAEGGGRFLREVGLTGASFGLGEDRVTPTRDGVRTAGVGIYQLSPSLRVQAGLLPSPPSFLSVLSV